MVPGALEAVYRAEESYEAKSVSGFVNATGGAGRRNTTVAMLTTPNLVTAIEFAPLSKAPVVAIRTTKQRRMGECSGVNSAEQALVKHVTGFRATYRRFKWRLRGGGWSVLEPRASPSDILGKYYENTGKISSQSEHLSRSYVHMHVDETGN